MKQTYKSGLKAVLLCLATVSLLTACGKDADGFLPDVSVKELTVTTHVNGYVPEGAKANSRASSSGNAFNFTAGDAIGLIALKNGSVMPEYNNIRLTYGNGGSWRSSVPIYDFGATSYIAYYPYRSDMAGKTSVDAIKNAFPIQNDQSTAANFNASNLLTATATLNEESMRFNFTPAFAMVEVVLPDEMKGYSNANGEKYTYKIYGSASAVYSFNTSWYRVDKIYRRIIKPSSSTEIKVTCKINNMPDITFAKSVTVGQGNYKKLVLGTANRNLEIGDFVYNDGGKIAFLPKTTASPSADKCIGIVMKMGKDTSGRYVDTDSYKQKDGVTPMSAHGYVLALYDAGAGGGAKWGSAGTEVDTYSINGFRGYSNTKKIKSMPGYSSSTFPACWYTTDEFEADWRYPSPSDTSGWYFPSSFQTSYWANWPHSAVSETILASIQKIISGYAWKKTYWTSTETSTVTADVAVTQDTGYNSSKDVVRCMRSCLTF